MKKVFAARIISLLGLSMFLILAPQVKASGVTLYPWPMFHHDSAHTGFSLSPAPNTNHVLWTFQTAGMIISSPAVVAGTVFVGTTDAVYAVDQINGNLLWSREDIDSWFSSPAVDNGLVFICDFSNIYALDQGTGRTKWSRPLDDSYASSPIVVGNLVIVGDTDGIYAFNERSGARVWSFSMQHVFSSVAEADGMLFAVNLVTPPCSLVALNEHNGHVVWSLSLDYAGLFVGSPTVADGLVFVPLQTDDPTRGRVLAFEEFTGSLEWQTSEIGAVYGSPAVAYGKVFVGSYDSNVYAFDEKSGRLIWAHPTGGPIENSSPAVADHKVFIGSDDYNFYALNERNGRLIWSLTTGYWAGQSSPAVADGVLFTGSTDGKLYAIGSHPR